ncbi:MAG TPA: SusF/SusE family outer membrane protein [Candidatus Phocaeicola excrementigallinarum]|nr:SusF/SusE family outer membrane protein [Candidatus Phocaeicola excrementigallinarum]
MKKLNILAYCLTGMLTITSCQDDRDDNPTIQHPDSFLMNVSSDTYNLKSLQTLDWSCATPDYGYTAALTYSVQISMDNTWTDATDGQAASYAALETTYTTPTLPVSASELNRALIILNGWYDEDNFPTTAQTVYVRTMSTISTAAGYEAYSEPAEIHILPYYEKVSAEPVVLYVVGDHQGWANNESAPKLTATDDAGTIFRGYVWLNKEFKFMTTTSWDDTNYGGGSGKLEAGGGNITVSTPGFYQIDVNTNSLTYTAKTCTWGIVGDATGSWDIDVPLTYNQESGTLETEVELKGGEFKFRQDGAWDISLGGTLEALELNGGNLTAEAGNYIVRLYLSDSTYHATLTPVE